MSKVLLVIVLVAVLLLVGGYFFGRRVFGPTHHQPTTSTPSASSTIRNSVSSSSNSDRYGVNLSRTSLAPLTSQALTYAKDANIGWIRGGCIWYTDEPSLDKWDWSSCDKYINNQSQSFNILALTQTPPPGCFIKPDMVKQENRWRCDLTNYQTYWKNLVTRYKDKVHYWEIGNEPDGYLAFGCNNQVLSHQGQQLDCTGVSMPSKYALILKTAHDGIKAADPNANVVLGGLALATQGSISFSPNFLSDIVNDSNNPMLDNIDIMNFHNYGDKTALKKDMDSIRSLVGNKPVWITEVGYSSEDNSSNPAYPKNPNLRTAYEVGEDGQANYLKDILPYLINDLGIEKVFWYTLYDQPDDKAGTFCKHGLLYIQGQQCLGEGTKLPDSANFIAKKAFTTFKSLITGQLSQ